MIDATLEKGTNANDTHSPDSAKNRSASGSAKDSTDLEKNKNGSTASVLLLWVLGVAVLVFMMVVVGGITRLTGSGLSMVEWRPVLGILPPLTQAEWDRIFALYQQSPEFIGVNSFMGLDEFKAIFFWEYVHRLLGRVVGVAYAVPLIIFALMGRIPKGLGFRLIIILALGAMQGVIGWWMVQSGLVDSPIVAPYRLAVHLSLALIILALLLWTALDLADGRAGRPRAYPLIITGIFGITIIAGALVAGLDAGLIYNEYPLMGGRFIPFEYGDYGWGDPWQNPASAQFHHRVLAVIMVLAIISLWVQALVSRNRVLILRGSVLVLAVLGQFILGLTVLLLGVPISLGVLHQGGAAVLLAVLIWYIHADTRLKN